MARLAAESYCFGTSWCSVRILVDGVEIAGASGAGAHTVSIEAQLVGGGTSPTFRLDDDTPVLQTIG